MIIAGIRMLLIFSCLQKGGSGQIDTRSENIDY